MFERKQKVDENFFYLLTVNIFLDKGNLMTSFPCLQGSEYTDSIPCMYRRSPSPKKMWGYIPSPYLQTQV